VQRLLSKLSTRAVDLFYRRRLLGGRVPAQGPVILVANHPNGLVDPVLVASATPRVVRFLGKAPLFDMPVLGAVMRGMRVLPVHRPMDGADTTRNEETFRAVHEALAAGDVVCLFPEGTSHSEPVLQRLKTGAARMALGAEARCGFELGVLVVPVGLVYRANRRFRSQVGVWVGEPIDVRTFREAYLADERATVGALTEAVSEHLRQVTLELDRWEDLPLLELAERIWRPAEYPTGPLPTGTDASDPIARMSRFAAGVRALRRADPGRVDGLARRIRGFRERLAVVGAGIDDLDLRYSTPRVLRFAARTVVWFLLGLPLALLGVVLWLLPYRAVPVTARWLAPPRDTHATVQILAGLVYFPLWLALLFGAVALTVSWPWALLCVALAPLLGLFALAFLEWRRDATADVSVFLRLGLRRRLKEHLRAEREALATEIQELADEVRAEAAAADERAG